MDDETSRASIPPTRMIDRTDLRAAATTLARAFADDPVWAWWLPGRAGDDPRTIEVFRCLVQIHLEHHSVWAAGDVGAVAVWAPPGKHRTTGWQLLPVAVPFMRNIGWDGLRRIPAMTATERLHPPEPHWYLALLGTDPSQQGRGLGSAAIAPVLARADRDGVGCWLESSKEKNVPFYRRHGFEVVDTHDLGSTRAGHSPGPRLWLMWRDPVAPPT